MTVISAADTEPVKKAPLWRWLMPAVGAQIAWGVWAFIPKMTLQQLEPHSVIFYAALGNVLLVLPILFYKKLRLHFDKKGVALTAAAASGTFVMLIAFFYALRNGPVSVVVTITALYPVITVLLARIILKEKINSIQILAIFLALLAIYLLAS